jgi:hypothetical protein
MACDEDAMLDGKTCIQCGATKPLDAFRPLLHFGVHGRDTTCIDCRKKR